MSEPTTIESSSFNQPSGSSVFQERMGDLDDYQFCPIKKENVEEEEEYLEVIEPGEESCQDDNYLAVEGTEEIPEMINLTGRGQTKVSGRQFFDDITDLVLKHPNEFRGTRYSFAKVAEELATKYGVEAGPDFRTRVAATWNNHRRYLMVLENKGRELTKREQWILNFKKGCNMEINESEPQVQAHQTTRHSRKKIKKTTALMEAVASCSHLKKSNKPGGNSVFWTLVEQRFLERLPNCSRKGLRPKLQQILSGVTVRARKKVASGRKLKSDEKLALKVNGNCNSPKNSTANGQDDLSHARRSRRSSTTVQNTSVTSLNYSDAFKFIVCNAVAKHPELFEAQRTRNFKLGKEIWKRIEQDIREGHPGPENLSAICQAWQRCKEHAFSHKKSGKMREIDKLVFDILSKNSPESLSRRLDTINRSVGQRDSNVLESLSTEMDTTVASERSENLSGRPRRSCRSSVANYKDPVLELSSEDDEINANSAAPSAAVSRRSVAKNSQRIELASAEAVAPTSSVIREGGGSNAPRNDDTSANNALQTPMPLTEKEPSPIRNLNSSTTSETASFSGSSTTEKVLREEGANRENKSLSLQEWLKVAEFCKRTKHAFRLDGNELVLTDREAPENEFRLPIDRVMSQLA